jgi:hypothetical protein
MTKKHTEPDTSPIKLPSERSFGLLFSAVLLFCGGYSLYSQWPSSFTYMLFASATFLLAISFFSPKSLAPLNKVWFLLGISLGKIVSPIVLGAIFFLLITPIAISMRIYGRDELKLHKRKVDTYWVDKSPINLSSESFKNQF